MYSEVEVYKIANQRLVEKFANLQNETRHKIVLLDEVKSILNNQTIEDGFKILVLKRLFKQEVEYENSKITSISEL